MNMITGRRRPSLVLFQTFTETDGQYGLTKTWAAHSRAWVNIEPDRAREQYKADEIESIVTHVVRGDYFELRDITPLMRMIYSPSGDYSSSGSNIPDSALVFNILAVIPAHDQRSDVMIKVEQEGRNYGEITS